MIWAAPGIHNPGFIDAETNSTILEEFMISYINQTVKAMGDYPFVWDVVNEAISNSASEFIKKSPWSQIDNFVCKAFKAARLANPKLKLFYNDYKHASMIGTYQNKSDKVFKLVKQLKDDGCGVDGVGFQSHIDLGYSKENMASIKANMKRYADIGVDVHFTEIDIRCNHTGECNFEQWPYVSLDTQATLYSNLLTVCLESPNCKSFETWGFTDKYSWMSAPQNGLPFDAQFAPKLAHTQLYNTLKNFPRDHPAVISRLNSLQNFSEE